MTHNKKRAILEAAAKACCYTPYWNPSLEEWQKDLTDPYVNGMVWNPLANPADCAEMCAKLEINHEHHSDYIQCLWAPQETYHVITMLKDHDNSRLKAWMYAATMCAAKIGDLK